MMISEKNFVSFCHLKSMEANDSGVNLPCQPEFQSNQPKYLMQPFPPPDGALHEI